MYSQNILAVAATQIELQLRSMPRSFTSERFLQSFAANYPRQYEAIIRLYLPRAADRPHALQTAHAMLMHTVNDRFHRLAAKTATIPNPKGGQMSRWQRT